MARHLFLAACSAVVFALSGCSSPPPIAGPPAPDPANPAGPGGADATIADSPNAPADDAGGALHWAGAPLMQGVRVIANRDSAVLVLPELSDARDYRAFLVPAGVSVEAGAAGNETVSGTVIHCAGFRQHNAPAAPLPTLLRQIEVTGLTGPSRVVVEAVDQTCPFPGVLGKEHATVQVGNSELPLGDRQPFSTFTEDEIRSSYGSLIVNGHGRGPVLGGPLPRTSPRVLARTTVLVTPSGAPPDHVATFFDSFDDASDQPVLLEQLPDSGGRSQEGRLLTNSRWAFYTWGADLSQFFIQRGQLHTVLADWAQEIFSSNAAYPRRTFALSDTGYLHLHYEVAGDTTARRYWWISICGAQSPGQTLDASGLLRAQIVQTPFFYQEDGLDPSLAGWNCLQVFPLDGSPFPLPPTNARPESDLRIVVNLANGAARDNVRLVSPNQYGDTTIAARSWYRQQRGNGGALGQPVLDDQMLISPRTRMDLYVRRDRAVVYVNGEQRVCNDFPNQRLTMAEGAVGFGQVLYHSAAERLEFHESFDDRTGQLYYLWNTPFVDARTWDNLGVEEGVDQPPAFDAGACFVSP